MHVFIDIGTTVTVGVKKVNACDCNYTVITNYDYECIVIVHIHQLLQ